MIPKIIHYCWFGRGQMPSLALKCIDSWKRYLSEYEFRLWNEDTFDVNSNTYVKEAYDSRKFAFVTDYVRLYALYKEGGVYMDTDVEVLKGLDPFLHLKAFSGFECNGFVPTGLMASEKGGLWVKELLREYDGRHFILPDNTLDMTTNTESITRYMKGKGLKLNNNFQDIDGLVTFYPSEYFCPFTPETGKLNLTENTYCIHHFANSWAPENYRRLSKIKKRVMKVIPPSVVNGMIKVLGLRKLKSYQMSKK
ncbi:glycosyltransferase family 32 protein [Coprobacter tertius]|uniref:Glycosyl transferase n=1 Tax=Coprobacter tertius TaxID=2944915 RepID=A0ABT1MJ97_9BACT|nr:glycosyltransferase [Coprobacter tertius]MCP9612688.1 glycosyl transferase [Coprobacter tertius]